MRGWRALCAAWVFTALVTACAPIIASHDAEVRFRTIATPAGSLRLAMIDEGRGPPIVLLHGFGTSSFTWQAILPELAKHHRVLAVDLRGFGASDKPLDEHYSIADQADAINALIEEEHLPDVTLVGHSFGGGVALLLALRDQSRQRPRIRSLILVDSIAYRQPIPVFLRLLLVPVVGEIGMALIPPEVQAAQGLRLAYFDKEKVPARSVAEYANTLYSPASKHALTKTVEHLIPEDIDAIAARYRSIKIPTLMVWGVQDKVVPMALGLLLHNNMPTSKLVVFDDCGHMPQEEKPQETVATLNSFLAETSKK